MTVQNACLIFIVCFSAITGWLMFREPASISVASIEAPVTEEKTSQVAADTNVATAAAERTNSERTKLDTLVIPVLDFREVALEDAVRFLNLKTDEIEGSERGFEFIIRRADHSAVTDSERTISVYLEDVSFTDALNVICEKAECRWELSDHQVIIEPLEQ